VGISFLKAAKPYTIPWNGNLALKFIPGQSHKRLAAATVTFFACKAALIRARGRSTTPDRVKIAAFRKEIPTTLLDSVNTDGFSKR
jgi:hypothetical protein